MTNELPTVGEHQQSNEIPASLRESRPTSSQVDSRPNFCEKATVILARYGVPDLYRVWRMKSFPEVKRITWDLGGVLIKGPTGTGKSCLAAALLRDRLRPDHPFSLAERALSSDPAIYRLGDHAAGWMRCGAVLFEARGAFREGGQSEASLIARCVRPRLLVLDDLCSGKMTDTAWTLLSEIIAQRVESVKDTIVTTNLTLNEIHIQEPRLASRLGAFEEIELKGPDRRLS